MAFSFTPAQMESFALAQARYWDAYFVLRHSDAVPKGAHWGTMECWELAKSLHKSGVWTDGFAERVFNGLEFSDFEIVAQVQVDWVNFRVGLKDLRENRCQQMVNNAKALRAAVVRSLSKVTP